MGGELGDFTIDQLGGTLALVLGSVGGLCLILFKSRCERISICWGLWSCNRKVQDDTSEDDEKKKDVEEPIVPPVPNTVPPAVPGEQIVVAP